MLMGNTSASITQISSDTLHGLAESQESIVDKGLIPKDKRK
jgi:hypothetical protein